jgi:hypothetical protein
MFRAHLNCTCGQGITEIGEVGTLPARLAGSVPTSSLSVMVRAHCSNIGGRFNKRIPYYLGKYMANPMYMYMANPHVHVHGKPPCTCTWQTPMYMYIFVELCERMGVGECFV